MAWHFEEMQLRRCRCTPQWRHLVDKSSTTLCQLYICLFAHLMFNCCRGRSYIGIWMADIRSRTLSILCRLLCVVVVVVTVSCCCSSSCVIVDPQLQMNKKNNKNYIITTQIIRTKRLNNLCRLIFFCCCCTWCCYCFMLLLLFCICNWGSATTDEQGQQNYTVTTQIIRTKRVNNLCRLIFLLLLLFLLLCNFLVVHL